MKTRTILPVITTITITASTFAQSAPSQRNPQPPISTQAMMQNNGGSLYQASQPQQSPMSEAAGRAPVFSLYAVQEPEPRVLKKHDLVNIIVREESSATATGTTDLKKNANLDAKVDQFVRVNLASLSLHGTAQAQNPVEVKLEGTRNFKGDATVDRTDSVVLRLEAEVIDVKPNGTLVIQAKKHIKTDDEEQSVVLTGTCRVQDVDTSNSVLSSDLHDLDLQKITKGAVRDTTHRGIVPRLLDFFNPF